MSAATTAAPPACDAYFSDNQTHALAGRAYVNLLLDPTHTRAVGSENVLGVAPPSPDEFTHLLKESLLMYRLGYCP
jgi:hypothetical protein